MNNRKAKALRRAVKENYPTANDTSYNEWRPPVYSPRHDMAGNLLGYDKVTKGTPLTLDQNCQRAIYKRLKKAA